MFGFDSMLGNDPVSMLLSKESMEQAALRERYNNMISAQWDQGGGGGYGYSGSQNVYNITTPAANSTYNYAAPSFQAPPAATYNFPSYQPPTANSGWTPPPLAYDDGSQDRSRWDMRPQQGGGQQGGPQGQGGASMPQWNPSVAHFDPNNQTNTSRPIYGNTNYTNPWSGGVAGGGGGVKQKPQGNSWNPQTGAWSNI